MSGVIAGLGLSAFSTGASLVQGINAKKLQKDAERAATESLNQAREKLSTNRLEGVQIPLDAYEAAMRETTAQSGQAVDALQQGDPRLLAAGIGKVYQAGAQQTEQVRQKQEQTVFDRETMIAEEQARMDRNLANLSLAEASGAQQAAAQYDEEAGQAFSNALSSFGDMAVGFSSLGGLYGNSKGGGSFDGGGGASGTF